jgi:hypothetical protein
MVERVSYVELYEKLDSQHKAWYLRRPRPQLVTYNGTRRGTTVCEALQACLSARLFKGRTFIRICEEAVQLP